MEITGESRTERGSERRVMDTIRVHGDQDASTHGFIRTPWDSAASSAHIRNGFERPGKPRSVSPPCKQFTDTWPLGFHWRGAHAPAAHHRDVGIVRNAGCRKWCGEGGGCHIVCDAGGGYSYISRRGSEFYCPTKEDAKCRTQQSRL